MPLSCEGHPSGLLSPINAGRALPRVPVRRHHESNLQPRSDSRYRASSLAAIYSLPVPTSSSTGPPNPVALRPASLTTQPRLAMLLATAAMTSRFPHSG
jgi:hypothetical protein